MSQNLDFTTASLPDVKALLGIAIVGDKVASKQVPTMILHCVFSKNYNRIKMATTAEIQRTESSSFTPFFLDK